MSQRPAIRGSWQAIGTAKSPLRCSVQFGESGVGVWPEFAGRHARCPSLAKCGQHFLAGPPGGIEELAVLRIRRVMVGSGRAQADVEIVRCDLVVDRVDALDPRCGRAQVARVAFTQGPALCRCSDVSSSHPS